MSHEFLKYSYLRKGVPFPSLGVFLNRIPHWNIKPRDMRCHRIHIHFLLQVPWKHKANHVFPEGEFK